MERIELLKELAFRAERCRARNDWQGVETYTATWLRVNAESDEQHAISGLARRMAANVAPLPLDERGTIPIRRVGCRDPWEGPHYWDSSSQPERYR
jgi:hypothetical protein